MSDGTAGYFIDGVGNAASPPFSLSDTYWNVRLGEFDRSRLDGLDSSRLIGWLTGASGGQMAGTGLPAIGETAYAVQTLSAFRLPVDKERVRRSLDELRTGSWYRAEAKSADGSWGSTALAVGTQVSAGLETPSQVLDAVRTAVQAEATRPTPSLVDVVDRLDPLLQIETSRKDSQVPRSLLQTLLDRSEAALNTSTQPDQVMLAVRYHLMNVAAADGLAISTPPVRLCQIVGRDGSVHYPDGSGIDLQSTYYALAIGCPQASQPPRTAHSRAGWPQRESPAATLVATAAALRIASLGEGPRRFADPVRSTLRQTWLPYIGSLQDVQYFGLLPTLAEVGRLVGGSLSTTDLRAPTSKNPEFSLPYLMAASMSSQANARDVVMTQLARLAQVKASAPISYAEGLELASRMLHLADLHQQATSIVDTLNIGPAAYAEDENGRQKRSPSFAASVVAAWIMQSDSPPVDHWIATGFCRGDGYCAEKPADLAATHDRSMLVLSIFLAGRYTGLQGQIPLVH